MLSLLLLACTAPAEGPTDAEPRDTADIPDTADSGEHDAAFEDIRRAARRDLRGANASGVSVAIWKDGEVIFAEGFGTRHPDTEDPVLPSTLFQIGSDTKKLTAIAALQQVAQGRLTLDGPIDAAVPDLAFADDASLAGTLTLHELLSHQSALFDYTPWVEAPEDADLSSRAVGRFADNGFAMGPSGLFWSYSNPGFSLAGLLTERADGRAWGDILEEDVFAPLGLTRTFARRASVETDADVATGYGIGLPEGYDTFEPLEALGYTFGTVPLEETWECGFTRPAGLVWSTASDMARLAGFLVDGDPAVLPHELHALLATPHVAMYPASDAADIGYGYGLMVYGAGWSGVEGYHPAPLWAHGGNTMTMTSGFYVLPEQRIAVSVLSNGYGDDFTLTAVTALEALTDLPTTDDVPALLAPPGDPSGLAGEWVDPYTLGALTLTWDGAALSVDAPDLDAAGVSVGDTMEPVYADLYLLRIDGADRDFSYYADADGGEWLVHRQFSWRRAPAADARATRTPPHPDESRLRATFAQPAHIDLRARNARLLGLE